MRGPPALGQAPGSPGVLCSLEDVSLPPSAAGSPPGPVALPPGGISRHLCLAAEPGTAPTGLGGQAALGRLHGKPTPSVTDGGAVPVAWGSVHGACSADAGSAFLCGLELSSGAWMVGGGSARLRSHLCRWQPEDPEGRPSRPRAARLLRRAGPGPRVHVVTHSSANTHVSTAWRDPSPAEPSTRAGSSPLSVSDTPSDRADPARREAVTALAPSAATVS